MWKIIRGIVKGKRVNQKEKEKKKLRWDLRVRSDVKMITETMRGERGKKKKKVRLESDK